MNDPDSILKDRHACLRIIQALKAGRAPREGIRFLSVGVSNLIEKLEQAFQRAQRRNPETLWFIGDYGEGKSHLLRLVATIAQEYRFAWAYVVHDKDQLIGLHKPAWLFRRLLFDLQWRSPNLHLDGAFVKEERSFSEICKRFYARYPESWRERAEYQYDRDMRRNLPNRLEELIANLLDDDCNGLSVCIDEIENCCLFQWNQHRPAYETLSHLLCCSGIPLVLCFGLTESGLKSLQSDWSQHVGNEAVKLLANARKGAITMPMLHDGHVLELAERIHCVHATAFDWQPTISSQEIARQAWEVSQSNSSGRWRAFVQSAVTQLEVAHQSVRPYQPTALPPMPPRAIAQPTRPLPPPPSPAPHPPSLKVGDRVEILKGPLRGWQGIVEHVSDNQAGVILQGRAALHTRIALDALKKLR